MKKESLKIRQKLLILVKEKMRNLGVMKKKGMQQKLKKIKIKLWWPVFVLVTTMDYKLSKQVRFCLYHHWTGKTEEQ